MSVNLFKIAVDDGEKCVGHFYVTRVPIVGEGLFMNLGRKVTSDSLYMEAIVEEVNHVLFPTDKITKETCSIVADVKVKVTFKEPKKEGNE